MNVRVLSSFVVAAASITALSANASPSLTSILRQSTVAHQSLLADPAPTTPAPTATSAVSCGLNEYVCMELPAATAAQATSLQSACGEADGTFGSQACDATNVVATCSFSSDGIDFKVRYYQVTMDEAKASCDDQAGTLNPGM